MLCAWMTPEEDIKFSLRRTERNDSGKQIVPKKEQIIISEEELSTLKSFFPVFDQFVFSRDSCLLLMSVSKRGVYLSELLLVP